MTRQGLRAATPRAQSGFTLIEIMVVVVILGILAALVVPQIISRPDEARVAKARQDIRAVESALKLYRLDNFQYPTTEQGLAALVDKPTTQPEPRNWKSGGYLDRIPTDPWGNVYHYRNPGEHGEIDVYTLGRDGRPGGEESDADIGNWALDS
ncbi:general secretion pathway protein G [Salinisphaera shabanensis T35B1]|jgi:general secretion pathway protein G|uniref:Type II secretion system core protein G n=1 Tax=Salinisphaera shabanensis E1L3A TaxID=1033802 RepID=F7Q2Y3_9GAMM|nr:type II secretion system major pseudopilin GspG [Salinisphaera shabanensis]ERJ17919.1 ral secretory pathway protein G [Salinisphaera shabanensis E1L3A]|tara:strand:- start:258 stop:716 length:459 start_codon:yes stop_codon:yes gene_type:complete